MKKITLPLTLGLAVLLTGCATGAPDMMRLQQGTTNELGLSSTDEVTLSNVVKGPASALGGSTVTWDATTTKGRKFSCKTLMMPSLNPLEKAPYGNFECAPK
ncbi:hypothetical protein [Entomohabitans teleogrylli]|uniref:hypothetical protein n=1 Tax=Entomohabitans teleogrylli TaxID=1384589 RepID=UPI00073DA972|nr:hypothetical protein [Entomohabitans teleogrylli]